MWWKGRKWGLRFSSDASLSTLFLMPPEACRLRMPAGHLMLRHKNAINIGSAWGCGNTGRPALAPHSPPACDLHPTTTLPIQNAVQVCSQSIQKCHQSLCKTFKHQGVITQVISIRSFFIGAHAREIYWHRIGCSHLRLGGQRFASVY